MRETRNSAEREPDTSNGGEDQANHVEQPVTVTYPCQDAYDCEKNDGDPQDLDHGETH